MQLSTVQAAVALIAIGGLVSAALISVVGQIWAGGPADLTLLLVGGLTGVTGPAIAFVFRSGEGADSRMRTTEVIRETAAAVKNGG